MRTGEADRACSATGRGPTRHGLVASVRGRLVARDDAGAALILALIFLVVAALALTALVTFAGGSLLNTSHLKSERGLQYAASSATDVAIQAVRYTSDYYGTYNVHGYTVPVTPPVNCLGPSTMSFSATGHPTSGPTAPRTFKMAVDCQGTANSPFTVHGTTGTASVQSSGTVVTASLFRGTPTSVTFLGYTVTDSAGAIPATPPAVIVAENNTAHTVSVTGTVGTATGDTLTLGPTVERKISFYTCRPTGAHTPTHPCSASNYLVHAVVWFNDVSPTPTVGMHCSLTGTTPPPTPTCGTAMVVKEWESSYANH